LAWQRFEAAHEGTLFLDEAGEMSLATQAKLLRVLAEGKILRVGSTKQRDVDVRVVAPTHRNLEERVKEGTFRQDLDYRLAVVPIHLAPLRERRDDIPGLVELFARRAARDLKVPLRPLRPEAIEKLRLYDFPGNIRELRNLIERRSFWRRSRRLGRRIFLLPLRRSRERVRRRRMSRGSMPCPSPSRCEKCWKMWTKG
jgi:DNA-binding NtrC family response regulator